MAHGELTGQRILSTSGVYVEHDDPWYRAVETDVIGGSKLMGHYTGTKAAGEGRPLFL